MKDLISLSDLVTRQKIFQAELLDELDDSKNKMSLLYNNIRNGKIKNDADALEIIYNDASKIGNLKKLKSRLQNRLVNSVFFLDQSGTNYDSIFKAGINCYKNYSAIRILISNRKRDVAIKLAEKTFTISRKYGFTDLNFLLSSMLAANYVLRSNRKAKIREVKILRDYYLKAIDAETEAEILYLHFNRRLSDSSAPMNRAEILEASNNVERLVKKQEIITTIRFNLFAFLYRANFYLETREYQKMIGLMNRGLEFYKEKGFKSVDGEAFLKTRGAIAYFMLKSYKKAGELFDANLAMVTPITPNWFSTQKLRFSLMLIQENYQGAFDILSQVINQKHFESTLKMLVQVFKINEAYIHFLVNLGKIDPSLSAEKPLRKFRLGRFMNDTPTYSKDKRGVNISILIIQLLLLVQGRKYGALLDKLDALNMYSHRYLRSDNTFRSNCFIKMLAKLPDADYNPIRWERYVKKYRERLADHPFELSYHNLDLEVIPFETLYDLVVEMLEKQKK